MAANPLITVEVIRNFSTGYHSRNGGGDLIQTDGDLPIIDLTRVDAPGLETPGADGQPRQAARPDDIWRIRWAAERVDLPRTGSDLIAVPSVVAQVISQQEVDVPAADLRVATIFLAVLLAVSATVDIGLGLAVLAGRNWARLLLMFSCVGDDVRVYRNARGVDLIALTELPSVAASILVLLALSSHRA